MTSIDNTSLTSITRQTSPNASVRGEPITYTADGQVKNYHYDLVWDFSSMEVGVIQNPHTVGFTATNPQFCQSIQDTLYYMYGWLKQKNVLAPSSGQLDAWRTGLQHISSLLGHTQWELLHDSREWQRFKRMLKKRGFGKKTIETNIVTALNKLFETGQSQQLVNGRELIALAISKPTEQAIAIPMAMYQQLLAKSIAMVEKYHEHRHAIANLFEQASALKLELKEHGYGKTTIVNKLRQIPHDIPDFNLNGDDRTLIQMACLVVVLAFCGARISEALTFNKECYDDKKRNSNGNPIPTLCGYTSKGNDGKPRLVTWQTHPVAKAALELAEDMSAPMRLQYMREIQEKTAAGEFDEKVSEKKRLQASSVFISLAPTRSGYLQSNIPSKVNHQAKKWGIHATQADVDEFNLLNPNRAGMLKIGSFLPKLSPHDFRRSFAVFFKRYNFGSAAGIKFQFKHHNIEMSKYYANNADLMHMEDVLLDKDLLNELHEAGIELGIDVYDEIYNQSEHLSGLGGEEIARQKRLNKLNSGCDVYMSRKDIEAHVRAGDFAIVQLPTGGYCTNADCNRICGQSIFNAETKKCMHTVYTDKSAKLLAKQRTRLIGTFRGLNTGDSLKNSILAGLKQKIQDAEITLKKHEIDFEPFVDRIAGTL